MAIAATELRAKLWPHGVGVLWRSRQVRAADALGLSMVANSQETPKTRSTKELRPRGGRGLTGYGKNILKSGAVILERQIGKECLSFATCTLPPSFIGEMRAARLEWPEILRRFLQALKQFLERRGLSGEIIGCSEIQAKRWAKYGGEIPPYHLHLVFQGRISKRAAWVMRPAQLTRMWRTACYSAISPSTRQSLTEWASSCQMIRVVKSIGRYLAKYLSKGGTPSGTPITPNQLIPSWYFISRKMLARIRANIRGGPILAEYIALLIEERNPAIAYHRRITPEGCSGFSFEVFAVSRPEEFWIPDSG